MGAQAVALFDAFRDEEGNGGVREQVGLPDAEIEPHALAGDGFILSGLAGAAGSARGIRAELVLHGLAAAAADGHQQSRCEPTLTSAKAQLLELRVAILPMNGAIAT